MTEGTRAELPSDFEAEAVRLASALCDGAATDADIARLETLLSDRRVMRVYLTIMDQHASLQWQSRWHTAATLPPRVAAGGSVGCGPGPAEDTAVPRSAIARRWLPVAMAAAAVAAVVAVGTFADRRLPNAVAKAEAPAHIKEVADARWETARPRRKGEPVLSGPLRLLGGLAQLQFATGATVVLNGPVDLEIVNGSRVFLRGGRITPFVPPGADGFTVVSPSGEITDLGTEFSVGVDDDGLTDVYVINGLVDVATGHARRERPLRMSQGFGVQLSAPSATIPDLTFKPFLIDHFDRDRLGNDAVTIGPEAVRWIDLDAPHAARVEAGSLLVPFVTESGPDEPTVRLLLDHDFTRLVGHKTVISYKVTLPPSDGPALRRWLAFVIDDGWKPGESPRLPLAHTSAAAAAVMVSPVWQAGVRIRGAKVPCHSIFPRGGDAVGPYQVLVSIDDSPDGRRRHGGTTLDVMVNGVAMSTARRIELGQHPRLGFQTYVPRGLSGGGHAYIDDLSCSTSLTDQN